MGRRKTDLDNGADSNVYMKREQIKNLETEVFSPQSPGAPSFPVLNPWHESFSQGPLSSPMEVTP